MNRIFIAFSLLAFVGCSARNHLGPQGRLERYATRDITFIFASADQVQRVCVKKVILKWPEATWDDGRKRSSGGRARACTRWYPNRVGREFTIYVSDEGDDWKSIPHEFCHIQIYMDDGMDGDHSRCANFGYGHRDRRMK